MFDRALNILRDGIAANAFSGASLAITHRGKLIALKGVGHFSYEPHSPAVSAQTIFDLASLSKVMATATLAMLLYQRGTLTLDSPVVSVVPEFATGDPRRAQVTIRMLLSHSSGMPAYERLFESASGEKLLQTAVVLPLVFDPGSRAGYSDIGFIVLGEALQRIAGEPLDSMCQREIFDPLLMSHTRFRPPQEWKEGIPPTENDRKFRKRVIQGEVHDENAWAMGGVAGHAGLFAPAADVARFAECMLKGGAPILRRETVELFVRRESSPPGTSRTLGWDTPTTPSQSGRYFSPRSFGHLGFTGTSLWIDPERQLSITLLTNRTWPDRSSQLIKEFRPRFHDAVLEELGLL